MWCFLVILILFNTSVIIAQSLPLLLFVSFDGFRHDYPKLHGPLKNFQRLAERGVHAQKMIPTFSTTTFANHYTLITGLYEEVHGIVSNNMYDPKVNITFESSGNLTNYNWWPLPSIWTINEQRKGGRSGVVSWPQHPVNVTKYHAFNKTRRFREIIDRILLWFNDPVDPINFGAIYYLEPDYTGHRTGPYSANMTQMVRECDGHLGYLLDKIDANENLRKNLHLIVTSDHGMEQINGTENPIYLDDYVDSTKIKAFGTPTVMSIFVQSYDIDIIFKNISKIPHSQSFKRRDIPDRYHYKNHERIGDILLILEPGYEIHRRSYLGAKRYNLSLIHGNHGYDNQFDSMKPIFYATGPKFKRNFTLDKSSSLYNVDLFGLMCVILDIEKCPPSNGSLNNVQPFLVKPDKKFMDIFIHSIASIAFGLLVLMAIIWSVTSVRTTLTMRNAENSDTTKQGDYRLVQINNPKNDNNNG